MRFMKQGPLLLRVAPQSSFAADPHAIGQTLDAFSGVCRNGEATKRPLHTQHASECVCPTMAAGTSPHGRNGLSTKVLSVLEREHACFIFNTRQSILLTD